MAAYLDDYDVVEGRIVAAMWLTGGMQGANRKMRPRAAARARLLTYGSRVGPVGEGWTQSTARSLVYAWRKGVLSWTR